MDSYQGRTKMCQNRPQTSDHSQLSVFRLELMDLLVPTLGQRANGRQGTTSTLRSIARQRTLSRCESERRRSTTGLNPRGAAAGSCTIEHRESKFILLGHLGCTERTAMNQFLSKT